LSPAVVAAQMAVMTALEAEEMQDIQGVNLAILKALPSHVKAVMVDRRLRVVLEGTAIQAKGRTAKRASEEEAVKLSMTWIRGERVVEGVILEAEELVVVVAVEAQASPTQALGPIVSPMRLTVATVTW
jgi:hypothetical protein